MAARMVVISPARHCATGNEVRTMPPTRNSCRILALAPNRWDGQWMNRQQLLSRIARKHPVLYSTGPWSIWDRVRDTFRTVPVRGAFLPRDVVMVDDPPRWLLRWPTHPRYDSAVIRAAQKRWRRHLDRVGQGPLIAYLFHPRYLDLVPRLGADRIIYHPYDLFRRMPDWSTDLARLEARLLEISDAVIATSEATRDALAQETSRPVHCIPNGVDADLFIGSRTADDAFPGIARPRIGYVGSINRKVDIELVVQLAHREPDWQFILMGPRGNLDETTTQALSEAGSLPNVHLVGARARQELPACMRSLDVSLMCYRRGTWMESAYPLKLHEYLASGPPVVSSDLPSVRPFGDVVAIARTADDWHASITAALRDGTPGTPAARLAVAAANTWDERVNQVLRILDGLAGTLAST